MAKAKGAKKGETREQFDERVKSSILRPETENYQSDGSIPPPPPGSDQKSETTHVEVEVLQPGTARRLRVEKQELLCVLTRAELDDRSTRLAKTFGRILEEKARQGRVKEEMKARMSALVNEQSDLSHAVLAGEEKRQVDVAIELLGDGKTVSEIRQDTLKPVNTRAATAMELQADMFGGAAELFPEK
jgi:hypothetical protein